VNSAEFPFGLTRDAAISVMLGHAVELREVSVGAWDVLRHEILPTVWGWVVMKTVEPIGGEAAEGRVFISDEAVAMEIVRPAMPDINWPPGRN
jgi:hypothetical protein